MFFSKSQKGFYAESMQADYAAAGTLPNDLQPISQADFLALMTAQSAGKVIDWSGDVPAAVDPLPVAPAVPSSVSPAQARLALLGAGLLDDVEAAVAAGPRAMQIAWQNASVIERNSPTVAALADALGLTDAQLDDLFTTAAGIFV